MHTLIRRKIARAIIASVKTEQIVCKRADGVCTSVVQSHPDTAMTSWQQWRHSNNNNNSYGGGV